MKQFLLLFSTFACIQSGLQGQTIIPLADELILPQYAYFGGVSNAHRVPFACRLKLTGLVATGVYRYQVGLSSNAGLTAPPATGQQAPGQMYRINNAVNPNYGHITGFTVNKSIAGSALQNDQMNALFTTSFSGSFTADAAGVYTGWFAAVPIGAAGQAKNTDAYFYVQLSGAGNTTFTQSYRTTSTIRLLDYTNDATGCTPLLGTSNVGGEKMVTLYDNTAGTGRPLYCTFTENNNNPAAATPGALNEGTLWNNPVLYPTIDGVSGSWAAIIPNSLSGGVKAINFLNIADASTVPLSNSPTPNISSSGTWNGVATASPAGDSTSPITINSIAAATLPVNLLHFTAKSTGEGIYLQWTTAQEVNNKYFEVRRAGQDGRTFEPIGKVLGSNNSQVNKQYQFVDRTPFTGVNYYQLAQVDVDGKTNFSRTVAIKNGVTGKSIKLVSSSSAELVVSVHLPEAQVGSIVFTDIVGRVVYNRSVSLIRGENLVRVPLTAHHLQTGVLSFSGGNERMTLKLIR